MSAVQDSDTEKEFFPALLCIINRRVYVCTFTPKHPQVLNLAQCSQLSQFSRTPTHSRLVRPVSHKCPHSRRISLSASLRQPRGWGEEKRERRGEYCVIKSVEVAAFSMMKNRLNSLLSCLCERNVFPKLSIPKLQCKPTVGSCCVSLKSWEQQERTPTYQCLCFVILLCYE